ncbi:unnamed protein product [Calypogeia fissa]
MLQDDGDWNGPSGGQSVRPSQSVNELVGRGRTGAEAGTLSGIPAAIQTNPGQRTTIQGDRAIFRRPGMPTMAHRSTVTQPGKSRKDAGPGRRGWELRSGIGLAGGKSSPCRSASRPCLAWRCSSVLSHTVPKKILWCSSGKKKMVGIRYHLLFHPLFPRGRPERKKGGGFSAPSKS